jgi:hypothetical protein
VVPACSIPRVFTHCLGLLARLLDSPPCLLLCDGELFSHFAAGSPPNAHHRRDHPNPYSRGANSSIVALRAGADERARMAEVCAAAARAAEAARVAAEISQAQEEAAERRRMQEAAAEADAALVAAEAKLERAAEAARALTASVEAADMHVASVCAYGASVQRSRLLFLPDHGGLAPPGAHQLLVPAGTLVSDAWQLLRAPHAVRALRERAQEEMCVTGGEPATGAHEQKQQAWVGGEMLEHDVSRRCAAVKLAVDAAVATKRAGGQSGARAAL